MSTVETRPNDGAAGPSNSKQASDAQPETARECIPSEMLRVDDDDDTPNEEDAQIAQCIENLRHDEERTEALSRIINMYTAKLDEASNLAEDARKSIKVYQRHVRTLVRLAKFCPHEGVRMGLTALTDRIAASGMLSVLVPTTEAVPSMYIPQDKVPAVDSDDAEQRDEFVEAFRADGRVSHMTLVMGMHPRYLARFREAHNRMLWDEGPLDLPYRHMIAILAAGRHQCQYTLRIHTKLFLDLGGEPKWLESSDDLPPKLKSLMPINNILAHQPWLLGAEDIGALIKSGVDYWSLNELTQAITIMAHFHALSSFTMGCGLNQDVDFIDELPACPEEEEESESAADAQAKAGNSELSSVIARLRNSTEEEEDPKDINESHFLNADTEGPRTVQDQNARAKVAFPPFMRSPEALVTADGASKSLVTGHVDFDIRTKDYSVLRTHEFSWGDQCFSTLNRYYPGIAELFDDEFNEIKNLTYEFMGNDQNVDTFKFRWAIFTYVLRIKGIINDEYMYKEVNQYLQRPVKAYVKTIVCYPQLSTKFQWRNFIESRIQDSERVHINLLAMAARKQAELLYGVHALSLFVSSRE